MTVIDTTNIKLHVSATEIRYDDRSCWGHTCAFEQVCYDTVQVMVIVRESINAHPDVAACVCLHDTGRVPATDQVPDRDRLQLATPVRSTNAETCEAHRVQQQLGPGHMHLALTSAQTFAGGDHHVSGDTQPFPCHNTV